jgi:hypothetical protein
VIRIDGRWLKVTQGRAVLLRGINLSGSAKLTCRPNGATHVRDRFFAHCDVSFVGRPFPLHEAGEHLARLREWGFTFLRLLVTWEAVAHAGPTTFDQEYLDYLRQVVARAHIYGFQVLIDPHQDVWSRFSGGDGAPSWTYQRRANRDHVRPQERRFQLSFRHDEAVEAPTEIYVPRLQYPDGYLVEVSDGRYQVADETQTLRYHPGPGRQSHWLRILTAQG